LACWENEVDIKINVDSVLGVLLGVPQPDTMERLMD
jgi:hypothetical protein